jgi:hypothetical protein
MTRLIGTWLGFCRLHGERLMRAGGGGDDGVAVYV